MFLRFRLYSKDGSNHKEKKYPVMGIYKVLHDSQIYT